MHHVLVSSSPLYLLGLEAVILRYRPSDTIRSFRSQEEVKRALVNPPMGLLWCALQECPYPTLSQLIDSMVGCYPDLRVMLLQHQIHVRYVKELFDHGISALLTDKCTSDEVVEAIEIAASGHKYIDRRIAHALTMDHLSLNGHAATHQDHLTDREKQVLRLIVDEFTTREIAAKLFISKCTVETHRLNLIRKLKVKNTAGLVREALTMVL